MARHSPSEDATQEEEEEMSKDTRSITAPGPIHSMPDPNPTATKLAAALRICRLGRTQTSMIEVPAHVIDQVIQKLEAFDPRVTELIKANSTEVIKRREINAHRKILMTLLQKLRDVLRGYASNHRSKVHSSSYGAEEKQAAVHKAERNDQLADEIDEALLWESPPGAMGKP
jgi:hypothetical protein